MCGDGLWTLSFGLSQSHGHGSWLVCAVALIILKHWIGGMVVIPILAVLTFISVACLLSLAPLNPHESQPLWMAPTTLMCAFRLPLPNSMTFPHYFECLLLNMIFTVTSYLELLNATSTYCISLPLFANKRSIWLFGHYRKLTSWENFTSIVNKYIALCNSR